MNKSPKHIRLLKMEIPETGSSSVVKEHHLPAAKHAHSVLPCLLITAQPVVQSPKPRSCQSAPRASLTLSCCPGQGNSTPACPASSQLLQEQGLPSPAGSLQHKKQQSGWVFQASGEMQFAEGCRVRTAAPGRHLVLPNSSMGGWVSP